MKWLLLLLVVGISLSLATPAQAAAPTPQPWWEFQSIDTMKFSRDESSHFLTSPKDLFDTSESQVKMIAETGATHVAIATPYDPEFLPVLREWVTAARRYKLHVWFRGNWSGWEGWFDHAKISRDDHLAKTKAFIEDNPDLFEDGDAFSACPECENGGPGDPRMTGDVSGHRAFLIKEHQVMSDAFASIDKDVSVNYNSMNADVAKLIMDPATTKALGGIVAIDHYVKDPVKLDKDVTDIAKKSGGKVVLGEFGAPIPDINGSMTESQQSLWIQYVLQLLAKNPNLVGLNYWTSVGGSTAIWGDGNKPKAAVGTLTHFFKPDSVTVTVTDPLGKELDSVTVSSSYKFTTTKRGQATLQYLDKNEQITVSKDGFQPYTTTIGQLVIQPEVAIQPTETGWWYAVRLWWHNILQQLF